ncbi:hypothetical protein CXB51_004855 [Gossypium anomalum]|uniref:Retrovirus-related Pol polyprotein from transposon TNT 1-94-like beta-barrel domain-containing protein n=1 Tax=Gossypium anomalum TaxID=47600 RepID=A0A8J5YXU0_9ROSI|nr:hypothetical protein CXB51_004855 [Gossypium anomalum]
MDAWKHSDFICTSYILNGLDKKLYDVYRTVNSVKALWQALDQNYKAEDAGLKKFIVENFLDFKMVDSKIVKIQVNLVINPEQWRIGIGAIRHIRVEKRMFSTYKEVDGEQLYIRNASTSKLLDIGIVILKMASGKLLTLNNVLHIIDIRKNLVSRSVTT